VVGGVSPALFVRQQDDISCGPACLATVANIYGGAKADYALFRELLKPDPKVGSCNFRLAEVSSLYLPSADAGEDCYAGGIAVANITEDEGHYVVFLCAEGDEVIYYDPWDHKIFRKRIAALNWISESGHLKRWAVNFRAYPGNSIGLWESVVL
jgi:hypothetical protein